jgi:ribosomal protein L37AE/L43A
MHVVLRDETRDVIRQRLGVIWCPFCDRSRQEARPTPFCEGCGAEFIGIEVETSSEPEPDGVDNFIADYNEAHPDQIVPVRRTTPRRQRNDA